MIRSLRFRLEWTALWLLKLVAHALPERLSWWVGGMAGRIVGRLWRRRRRIAHGNLSRAFPEWNSDRVEHVVKATFNNLGRTTFEILRLGRQTQETILSRIDPEGVQHFERVIAQGRGALLLTGHFGNWELLGAWVCAQGFPLDVVVKPARNPWADRFYNDLRLRAGMGVIHTQVATLGIARALQARRFVAILADQYAGAEGIEVEFFGRMVSTPRGPAALALRFRCPVLTGCLVREAHGRFTLVIDGPIELPQTGDAEQDLVAVTQEYTRRLEQHVRRHPEQWLWTHRRWRD
ncbi:MAG: lysophospholipid acyltransferase family protein [Candidatus Zixiibacteriota bacterium]